MNFDKLLLETELNHSPDPECYADVCACVNLVMYVTGKWWRVRRRLCLCELGYVCDRKVVEGTTALCLCELGHVCDRKVVEGTAALAAIESQETANERPVNAITVFNCGLSKFVF